MNIITFSLMLFKIITIQLGVPSLQLSAKYHQLPATLIDEIGTPMWRILCTGERRASGTYIERGGRVERGHPIVLGRGA